MQLAETENIVANPGLGKTTLVDALCSIEALVKETDRLLAREEWQLLFDMLLDLGSELLEVLADEHGALRGQTGTL